jgi:putative tryptophan/tyrosine transport system substrate-binding protein
VFTTGGDPVKMGLVSSLAQPGGNITGTTTMNLEVAAKRLQLMHELLPTATNIALLVNPADPLAAPASQATSAAAAELGLKLHMLSASSEPDLATAFDSLLQLRTEALVITTATLFNTLAGELGRLSASHRVPAIYEHREFTAGGGLMSYSSDLAEAYRLVGVYVGRILKGEKPAELPVQQATNIKLLINLKTAKALGITFPLSLLGRADEVFE